MALRDAASLEPRALPYRLPQRAFFFRVVPWILLAAFAAACAGSRFGGGVGERLVRNPSLRRLSPVAAVIAVLWLLFTIWTLVMGLVVRTMMPGWEYEPQ